MNRLRRYQAGAAVADPFISLNPFIFTAPGTGNQYNGPVQLDEPFRPTSNDLAKLFVIGDSGRSEAA